jgi:CRP-like cAMP-binding protein/Fe-S-cluster-containing hydrogenase component 2/thioredoxin reductase
MGADFTIAIVGSGPAGLSAAVRAAMEGKTHILLERAPHLNDTIFKYQKRKHVMAAPEILPLRSDLAFKEQSREEVIESWTGGVGSARVNLRLSAEVTSIKGQRGNFEIGLAGGEKLSAEYLVLAIGLQGNLRQLPIPGADLPFVQYQLDDPDEYKGEEIVVIGTGDAGIENALGLSANNNVSVINRAADFPYAKPANAALIQSAINRGDITAFFNAEPKRVEPGYLVLDTHEGETSVKCDRIIARIGALPPRRFVESCGIVFPSDSPTAFPQVSETYESQVPGLYIIGALAGYPLIKQCLNQGYEVVEYILGKNIAPADEPLIRAKLDSQGVSMTVSELVTAVRERLPLYAPLTPLQTRELLIHCDIHQLKPGDIVFRRNDYTNSLYSVLDGQVGIQIHPDRPDQLLALGRGQFFGEIGLIAGRRRTATIVAITSCLLLEADHNTMIRLVRTERDIRRVVDEAAVIRFIRTYLATDANDAILTEIVRTAEHPPEIVEFKPNAPADKEDRETLIREGATDDNAVYLIRKGSVTVSRRIAGKDTVFAYVAAGNLVGEMAVLQNAPRSATVKATVLTEAIKIDRGMFQTLLDRSPAMRQSVDAEFETRLRERRQQQQIASQAGDLIEFFARQGLGEATDVLLIDESLCVRCDNCEKACAETHHGVSRLNREAGMTYAAIHVPTSCRHCEYPHCMKDCPPDAIHRAPTGEVFIADNCIGCGNCERNCPYGVIQMAEVPAEKPGLLSWLLFGWGSGPGEDRSPEGMTKRSGGKHAVKCDMCRGIEGGPACVRACPTGAAIRVDPEQFLSVVRQGRV